MGISECQQSVKKELLGHYSPLPTLFREADVKEMLCSARPPLPRGDGSISTFKSSS